MGARKRHHGSRKPLDQRIQGHRIRQQGADARPAQIRRRIPPHPALQRRTAGAARLPPFRNGPHLRRAVRIGRRRGQSQGHSLRDHIRHRSHPVQFAGQGVRTDRRGPDRGGEIPRGGRGTGDGDPQQRLRRLHELPHHAPEPLRGTGAAGPRLLDDGQTGPGRGLRREGDRQRQIPADDDRRGLERRGDRHAQHAGDRLRALLDAVHLQLLPESHLPGRNPCALQPVFRNLLHRPGRHGQALLDLVRHGQFVVHQALQQDVRPGREQPHVQRQINPRTESDPDSRNVLHRGRSQPHERPGQGDGIP